MQQQLAWKPKSLVQNNWEVQHMPGQCHRNHKKITMITTYLHTSIFAQYITRIDIYQRSKIKSQQRPRDIRSDWVHFPHSWKMLWHSCPSKRACHAPLEWHKSFEGSLDLKLPPPYPRAWRSWRTRKNAQALGSPTKTTTKMLQEQKRECQGIEHIQTIPKYSKALLLPLKPSAGHPPHPQANPNMTSAYLSHRTFASSARGAASPTSGFRSAGESGCAAKCSASFRSISWWKPCLGKSQESLHLSRLLNKIDSGKETEKHGEGPLGLVRIVLMFIRWFHTCNQVATWGSFAMSCNYNWTSKLSREMHTFEQPVHLRKYLKSIWKGSHSWLL